MSASMGCGYPQQQRVLFLLIPPALSRMSGTQHARVFVEELSAFQHLEIQSTTYVTVAGQLSNSKRTE